MPVSEPESCIIATIYSRQYEDPVLSWEEFTGVCSGAIGLARAASVSPVGPEPKSPWINVEERLPEKNDEFLVKCSDCDYAIPADWFDGTWKTMRGYGNEGEALELHLVTHWMLMPDPPEAVGPEPAKEKA